MKLHHLLLAISLCALGCKSAETSSVAEAERGVVAVEGEFETTWDYLADKYDADGDGVIAPEEFGRGGETFEGHDRNGDGMITFGDYDPDTRRARQEAQRRGDHAHAMVALYLQADEDPERLDGAELEVAFASYAGTDGGRLESEAFAAGAEQRSAHGLEPSGITARRLEDEDPFETMSAVIDEDADGALSRGEVTTFFERYAQDGVWLLGSDAERRGSSRPSAPEVGEVAPDFTLRELNGDDLVTLSSFAGDQPVALVFGSYT